MNEEQERKETQLVNTDFIESFVRPILVGRIKKREEREKVQEELVETVWQFVNFSRYEYEELLSSSNVETHTDRVFVECSATGHRFVGKNLNEAMKVHEQVCLREGNSQ